MSRRVTPTATSMMGLRIICLALLPFYFIAGVGPCLRWGQIAKDEGTPMFGKRYCHHLTVDYGPGM